MTYRDGWLMDGHVAVSPDGSVTVVDYGGGERAYVLDGNKIVGGRFKDFDAALKHARSVYNGCPVWYSQNVTGAVGTGATGKNFSR